MAQNYRLKDRGRVDLDRPIDFTYNGKRYRGYAGDTVASALLANGVHLVGRSFKYHRPRGILGAGSEEPNALLQVESGARTLPNVRATQAELYDGMSVTSVNAWPGPEADVGAVNQLFAKLFPAGFYYKTFMWPAKAWPTYEKVIRHAAGLGKAPTEPDPDFYDKRYAHCDVLIAGGGPSGLAAALTAARSGARVILADENAEFGGSLLSSRETIDGKPAIDWVAATLEELRQHPDGRILPRTIVFGYYDHNWIDLLESRTDHLSQKPDDRPRQRMWKVRAQEVVLATGAIERPLVFVDNDRPGILLASAARTYVNRYGVKPGERCVLVTNNDGAYQAALDMQDAGVEIAAAIDIRAEAAGPFTEKAKQAGIRILANHGVAGVEGAKRVRAIKAQPLAGDGESLTGSAEKIACDVVANSGGWNPSVHLFSQSRGKLRFEPETAAFVPDRSVQRERSAGSCQGTWGLKGCLKDGLTAGAAAAKAAGFPETKAVTTPKASDEGFLPARWLWTVPGEKPVGHKGKHFVDYQNDVTAADLLLAIREGYTSIEHVKRYTTTGMATDQGKTSNVNALGIVSQARGLPIPEIGTTTFRPPYTPVTFGAWGGRDVGDLFDAERHSPMHAWHVRAGAEFENVGLWKRPWYYPKPGESMHDAVQRESKATRDSVGILDATTLGRIDIQGPDAVEFLNRVYTNGWKTLKPGMARYGLMLGEDGMVMDDGVTACLGENHYLMHTTSGGAGDVLAHLEEYLQTEWPDLRVYLTTVTEQYATAALAGPNARKLLQEVTDIDLAPEAFPFMTFREGTVAGVPARVFRISFSGDLSFEINVHADHGLHMWQTLMSVGEKYDITPYGTETMHVLRAEKGFIIVGQETDGTVTPMDLGMDKLCSSKKDFIGKRSLARPDMLDPERKQFVGLLPDDPGEVLEEGAQLVAEVKDPPPMDMVGHVSSSYMSPNLGRSFALALVEGGHHKHGHKVFAPMPGGKTIACTITNPVFFDPEGERLRA